MHSFTEVSLRLNSDCKDFLNDSVPDITNYYALDSKVVLVFTTFDF